MQQNQYTFYYHINYGTVKLVLTTYTLKLGDNLFSFLFAIYWFHMKHAILRHPVFPWIHWHLQSIRLCLCSLYILYFSLYLSLHFICFNASNKIWMLHLIYFDWKVYSIKKTIRITRIFCLWAPTCASWSLKCFRFHSFTSWRQCMAPDRWL